MLGTLGLLGSWFTGTARIPFVVGLDHYLPDAVAKVHPRWGSPINSLLMQATVMTVLFVASIVGSTVTEAFLVLLDMSIILYFIPFLYLFATRRSARRSKHPRSWRPERPLTAVEPPSSSRGT